MIRPSWSGTYIGSEEGDVGVLDVILCWACEVSHVRDVESRNGPEEMRVRPGAGGGAGWGSRLDETGVI